MAIQFPDSQNHVANVRPVSGVSLERIAYDAPSGDIVHAYVVRPVSAGPFPAILYVHWYEPHSPVSNRAQFINEGMAWAENGVLSLHISTPWSVPMWFPTRDVQHDYDFCVRVVSDVRCALAVLRRLDGVDSNRIAYVGHDFGAMYGVLAASQEPMLKALVFMAGTAHFADWFLFGRKLEEAEKQAVRDTLAPLDPATYIGKLSPIPVLMQFGTGDFYVPDDRAQALYDAAGEPKKMGFYQGEHGLDEHARTERVLWLAQYLGITIAENWFVASTTNPS